MSLAKKLGLSGLVFIGVVGCDAVTPVGDGANASGFQAKYMSSRIALEKGDYKKAMKGYTNLLTEAGPHETRIRLEYSHTLLRTDAFGKAANEARVLARQEKGGARSAALAVQGTAEHELALFALRGGDVGDEPRKLLKSAYAAISEVLKNNPEMDPLGSLAKRKAEINAQLN